MTKVRKADTSPGAAKEVREVMVGNVKIGGKGNPCAIIAGPDVLEELDEAIHIATELKRICDRVGLPFIFKASYDKGNRADQRSYRGPLIEKGLEQLATIRSKVGCPVLTDVHTEEEAKIAGKVVDVIQLPAYLCMQTALTIAIAETGKPVNVKKGQFAPPRAMASIARKIESTGNMNVFITERGASFGYSDLVADFRNLPLTRSMGYPIVLDPTHIIRYPGISAQVPEGGEPEYVPHLCRAGVAAGVDALFIETHPEPRKAACDAASMLRLKWVPELLEQVAAIDKMVKQWDLSVRGRDEHGFV